MPTSELVKAKTLKRAEEIYSKLTLGHPEYENSGGCLLRAASVVHALRDLGIRGALQAGSCQWQRLTNPTPETDNALFGYVWEFESKQTQQRLAFFLLPEIHCWAAIPDTNEIIDVCSGYFPEQCQKLLGIDWPGIQPPKVLWAEATLENFPKGAIYKPDPKAIEVALRFYSMMINS